MKKNNQGFMLAELIITSTVIVTALVGLYASYNKVYSLYQTKNNYYNIDGVYATKEMINGLLKTEGNNEDNLNSVLNKLQENNYIFIIQTSNQETKCNITNNICSTIKNLYEINNMILVEYDENVLQELKNQTINKTFKEYIDYIIGYYGIKDNEDYSYIVLTEIKMKDNEYNYSNLRIG